MSRMIRIFAVFLLFFGLASTYGYERILAQAAETEKAVEPAERSNLQYAKYNRIRHFDKYFIKYSKRYFGPGFDWRYFKAQAIAESKLDPDAQSSRGATGLMQIMPSTWEQIRTRNPYIKGSRKEARWNIAAGIWYDYDIWRRWSAKRTQQDRINFMMASFNAGLGHIMNAQRLAASRGLNHRAWESIETTLPEITGRRSRETIRYVNRINEIKLVLH